MTSTAGTSLMAWVPCLRRYAHALIHHPDDADDLVQATLERAWVKAEHWPRVTDMRAWLFALMHNPYLDRSRRPRLTRVELDDALSAAATTSPHEAGAALLDLKATLARTRCLEPHLTDRLTGFFALPIQNQETAT